MAGQIVCILSKFSLISHVQYMYTYARKYVHTVLLRCNFKVEHECPAKHLKDY